MCLIWNGLKCIKKGNGAINLLNKINDTVNDAASAVKKQNQTLFTLPVNENKYAHGNNTTT